MNCLPVLCNNTVIYISASSIDDAYVYLDEHNVSDYLPKDDQMIINYSLDQLLPFRHYNLTIRVLDPKKSIKDQNNLIICKFYMQLMLFLTAITFCSYPFYSRSQYIQ